jgi:hypothetical protein
MLFLAHLKRQTCIFVLSQYSRKNEAGDFPPDVGNTAQFSDGVIIQI